MIPLPGIAFNEATLVYEKHDISRPLVLNYIIATMKSEQGTNFMQKRAEPAVP